MHEHQRALEPSLAAPDIFDATTAGVGEQKSVLQNASFVLWFRHEMFQYVSFDQKACDRSALVAQ